jgi:hypothetical protein
MQAKERQTDNLRAKILVPDVNRSLGHACRIVSKAVPHLPGPAFADSVVRDSDQPPAVLRCLQMVSNQGRLGATGYLPICPARRPGN